MVILPHLFWEEEEEGKGEGKRYME